MLQELREAVKAASALLEEIGSRLRRGDAAPELVERLAARVAEIESRVPRGATLPPELQAEIGRLLAGFEAAVHTGDDWLTNVGGTELASQQVTDRLRQAYGLTPNRHLDDPT